MRIGIPIILIGKRVNAAIRPKGFESKESGEY